MEEEMEGQKSAEGFESTGGRGRIGSIGVVEELAKRKREELENSWEQIFQKSSKTERSSPRKKGTDTTLEEVRDALLDIKREVRDQGKRLGQELEDLKREFREQMKEGREEREVLRAEIEKIEKRVIELEKSGGNGKSSEKKGGKEGDEILKNRLKSIERKLELKEREKRRRNIIVRGLKVEGENRREKVEELMREIGVEVDILETKKIGEDREKGREMVWVKLRDEEQRGKILEKKSKLKGKKERIGEDLTWRERKMKWKLEEIAREEEKEGKTVWIRYGRIRIDNIWWRWDEDEEVLRDGNGNVKELKKGL
ncbi:PREDICTED: golgin subfamily A member 6-like protein 2 [Vollenhovia emeryi]|uniref:golgin subfamily A member 6-like protein 2 n=1 Tax=Vollenhovia emeryi TaxID=411798 RepID=UPI0005F444E2|nr:PREDICTED: golgin subfamily A member 6-like protein 2 [Vollenhovia emeryi]